MPDHLRLRTHVTEPAASSATASAHLPALDGLRALASLFVFNVHAFGYCLVAFYGWTETEVRGFPGWGVESALLWLHRSLYGVDLFFVLSGFLMARQFDFARARPVDFLARRALRILPPILALVLAAARAGVDDVSRCTTGCKPCFLHGFLDLAHRDESGDVVDELRSRVLSRDSAARAGLRRDVATGWRIS
jgi:hypothetical protein